MLNRDKLAETIFSFNYHEEEWNERVFMVEKERLRAKQWAYKNADNIIKNIDKIMEIVK